MNYTMLTKTNHELFSILFLRHHHQAISGDSDDLRPSSSRHRIWLPAVWPSRLPRKSTTSPSARFGSTWHARAFCRGESAAAAPAKPAVRIASPVAQHRRPFTCTWTSECPRASTPAYSSVTRRSSKFWPLGSSSSRKAEQSSSSAERDREGEREWRVKK